MSAKKRHTSIQPAVKSLMLSPLASSPRDTPGAISATRATEACICFPLSALCLVPSVKSGQEDTVPLVDSAGNGDEDGLVPVTPLLNSMLRAYLRNLFPRYAPLSTLLLHVSQLEPPTIPARTEMVQRRRRYHAPVTLLEQILTNVRRAVRIDDSALVDSGTGAAFIFPDVDQQGAFSILERVYRSVCLLQAETVIPPLSRETDIVLGIGTYPVPGQSLEELLCCTGRIARRLTLRPAITPQLWNTLPGGEVASVDEQVMESVESKSMQQLHSSVPLCVLKQKSGSAALSSSASSDIPASSASPVPFLRLPGELPLRLKNVIPHAIALQLQCVPVGRDSRVLTVAMADPTNASSLQRLKEITGMNIFPVSCDVEALNTLLGRKW